MRDIYRLTAVLRGSDGRDNLRGNGARGLERFRAFNHFAVHDRAVFEHVLNIDKTAVEYGLEEIIGVVEVQNALVVRLGNFFGQQDTAGQILRDLARNQIALGGSRARVLVGVFLHYVLIIVFNEGKYAFVRGVRLADKRTLVTVKDIRLHKLILLNFHQLFLYHILNIFDEHASSVARSDIVHDCVNLRVVNPVLEIDRFVCPAYSPYNLALVEINGRPVALNNLHCLFLHDNVNSRPPRASVKSSIVL